MRRCRVLFHPFVDSRNLSRAEVRRFDDLLLFHLVGAALVPLVVMTHRTTYGSLLAADAELDRLDSLRGPRVRMPVAD